MLRLWAVVQRGPSGGTVPSGVNPTADAKPSNESSSALRSHAAWSGTVLGGSRSGHTNESCWWNSVTPVCVSKRGAVELVPVHAPLRHAVVYEVPKPVVVSAFDDVHQFVRYDVLEARYLFLRQFKIQPDSAGILIARPPKRLHLLDSNLTDPDSNLRFPFRQERWQTPAELTAIPSIEDSLAGISIGTGANP